MRSSCSAASRSTPPALAQGEPSRAPRSSQQSQSRSSQQPELLSVKSPKSTCPRSTGPRRGSTVHASALHAERVGSSCQAQTGRLARHRNRPGLPSPFPAAPTRALSASSASGRGAAVQAAAAAVRPPAERRLANHARPAGSSRMPRRNPSRHRPTCPATTMRRSARRPRPMKRGHPRSQFRVAGRGEHDAASALFSRPTPSRACRAASARARRAGGAMGAGGDGAAAQLRAASQASTQDERRRPRRVNRRMRVYMVCPRAAVCEGRPAGVTVSN